MKLIDQMTKEELKIELAKEGVAFKSMATVEQLRIEFQGAIDRKGLGIHPKNDPVCDSFESPSAKNEICIACAADHSNRFDACNEIAAAAKAATKKTVPLAKRETVKAKYSDIKDLRDSINAASDKRLTMFVDKLLVKGGQTMAEILTAIEARKKEVESASTDFKNVSIIKKHLKYRAAHGWVFEIYKNGNVKVIGYDVAGGEIREPMPEEEKKAA